MENLNNQSNINESEFSFEEILFIIKKNKILVSLITTFTVLISIFFTLLQKPIYESSAMIMIEEPSSKASIFDMGIGSDQNYLDNEIKILTSRSTAERTIQKLLESKHLNNLFLFETKDYKPNGIRAEFMKWIGFLAPLETKKYIKLEDLPDHDFNDFVSNFRNSLRVSNQKRTDMLQISMQSIDSDEATLLANTLIEVYRLIDLEWATGEMSHLKTFLNEQITLKEVELKKSEDDLRSFQEKYKIFGIDNNSKLLLQNLMNAESELYNTKAEYNIAIERKRYIQSLLTDEEKNFSESVSNTINDRLIALKKEIAIKEAELISAISQQGEEHNIVKSIKEKLRRLKESLEIETRNLISKGISAADPIKYRQTLMDSVISITAISAMLNTRTNELEKLVFKYQNQITTLPEKALEYARLSRNLNIDTATYSLMRQKLEEARINEASKIGKVRIVDPALSEMNKVKPNARMNIFISLVLGFSISIGLAFLLEFFDNTIKSVDFLEKKGLSILALIPSIVNQKVDKKVNMGNVQKIKRRIITREDPKSPVSEAYRSLRTSLMYSDNNRKDSNVILVSSSEPGEGKTTTIVNLAITYANLGKKTLLIDTDLRKPVIHQVFSVSREPGITKYLSGLENNFKNLAVETEVENLSVITCGVVPPNPSEILASNKMKELIESLRKDYDVILLDSPPLLAVTDSFVTMKYVDQFILVVRSGSTVKGALNRSLAQLELTNSPLTGAVLNAVDESTSYGGNYYYNYYHYYRDDNS